jgi:hypothetical protein
MKKLFIAINTHTQRYSNPYNYVEQRSGFLKPEGLKDHPA